MEEARKDASSSSTAVASPDSNAGPAGDKSSNQKSGADKAETGKSGSQTGSSAQANATAEAKPDAGKSATQDTAQIEKKASPKSAAGESVEELAEDFGKGSSGSTKESRNGSNGARAKPGSAAATGTSQSGNGNENAESKQDGEQSALDPKTEAFVKKEIDARLKSLLDERMEAVREPLLEVNRQLGLFLGEQMEITLELRQQVRAMERLLASDPRRKDKYAATLEEVKSEGDGMADPHWINRTRGMLSQLKRTGTTGPKPDAGPDQD